MLNGEKLVMKVHVNCQAYEGGGDTKGKWGEVNIIGSLGYQKTKGLGNEEKLGYQREFQQY